MSLMKGLLSVGVYYTDLLSLLVSPLLPPAFLLSEREKVLLMGDRFVGTEYVVIRAGQ